MSAARCFAKATASDARENSRPTSSSILSLSCMLKRNAWDLQGPNHSWRRDLDFDSSQLTPKGARSIVPFARLPDLSCLKLLAERESDELLVFHRSPPFADDLQFSIKYRPFCRSCSPPSISVRPKPCYFWGLTWGPDWGTRHGQQAHRAQSRNRQAGQIQRRRQPLFDRFGNRCPQMGSALHLARPGEGNGAGQRRQRSPRRRPREGRQRAAQDCPRAQPD